MTATSGSSASSTPTTSSEAWCFLSSLSVKKTLLEKSADSIFSDLFSSETFDFDAWFRRAISSTQRQRIAQILQLPVLSSDILMSLFYDPTIFGGSMKGLLQRRLFYCCKSLQGLLQDSYAPKEWGQLYGNRLETMTRSCAKAVDELQEGDLCLDNSFTDLAIQSKMSVDVAGLFRTPSIPHQRLLFVLMRLTGVEKLDGNMLPQFISRFVHDDATNNSDISMLSLRLWLLERVLYCVWRFQSHKSVILILKRLETFSWSPFEHIVTEKSLLLGGQKFPELPEIYDRQRYCQFYLQDCMHIVTYLRYIGLQKNSNTYHDAISKLLKRFTVPYPKWNGLWQDRNLPGDQVPFCKLFDKFVADMGNRSSHPWWVAEELRWLYKYFQYMRKMLILDSKDSETGNIDSHMFKKGKIALWNTTYKSHVTSVGSNADGLKVKLNEKAVGIAILGPPGTGKSTMVEIISNILGFKHYRKADIVSVPVQYITSLDALVKVFKNGNGGNANKPKILLFDEFHSQLPFNQYSFFLSPLEEGILPVPGKSTIELKNHIFIFATSAYRTKDEFLSEAVRSNNYPMRDFSTRISAWLELPSYFCLPHDTVILLKELAKINIECLSANVIESIVNDHWLGSVREIKNLKM